MKKESKFEINNIIIEGVDKTGKDTLIEHFHKLTHYKYPVINRLWATIFAHGIYNDRNLRFDNLYKMDSVFAMNGSVLVYVTANTDILKQRFLKTFEKDIKIEDIDKLKVLFEEYLRRTKIPVIRIDTSNRTPEDSSKELLYKLNLIGVNGLNKEE
jgi:thymidylate kinase